MAFDAAYHRKRKRARRKKFLALLGGLCVNCGSNKNLHFDHKDPKDKEIPVSRYLNRKEEFVMKELDKCQLLCQPCHKQKTLDNWEFGAEAEHGTAWRYKKYKCRCEKCKQAMSNYQKSRK